MKDRISTHPGRVQLVPVAGQANTFDMLRADEPTEVGTPLNKANLLSDGTAALIGVAGDDATVNGALKNIWEKKTDKVADASAGNLAALNADGNLTDSGRKVEEIPTAEKMGVLSTRTEIFREDGVFRVPNGVSTVHVLLMGGGGSGYTYTTKNGYSGAGGGGGYFSEADIDVNPREIVMVTIGKGGIAPDGVSGSTAGGASSFGIYLSADGGAGGGSNEGGSGGSGGGSNGDSSSSAVGGTGGLFGGGGSGYYFSSVGGFSGALGGDGGRAGRDGGAGVDTSKLDVMWPGVAPGGVGYGSPGGAGGGGGYGAPGGAGGEAVDDAAYHGGCGGGGGYGAPGGAGGNTSKDTKADTSGAGGGGGGGGYGPAGKGGKGGDGGGYGNVGGRGENGGIAAGGGGAGGFNTIGSTTLKGANGGNGGDGICIVTYTLVG